METIELKSLIGKHWLTGVDYETEQVKEDYGDYYENCQVIRFVLDGKTYTAIEDPSDGYRSHLRSISVSKHKVKNKFQKVLVMGIMKPAGYNNNDTLQLYDVETGLCVLEVGTDNNDDYYPSFVGAWMPENLVLNSRAAGKKKSLNVLYQPPTYE
jgi:hypothetical protein